MTSHPGCPAIDKETGRPRSRGQTFTQENGDIFYYNVISGNYERAVRLNDVRLEVIQDYARHGSYTHGRTRGGERDNITSFLPQDRDVGGQLNQLPQLLFDIMSSENQHSRKPTDYVRHRGRILLDPYYHGIRDFPGELPVALSTELEGWNIEYLLRKNKEITIYDLMARMNSNFKDSEGKLNLAPPRLSTLNERATMFRERAALLAVSQRAESHDVRAQSMNFLPPGAPDMRSLERHRTTSEIDALKAGSKDTHPEKRKSSKQTSRPNQTPLNYAGSVNGAVDHNDGVDLQQNDDGELFITGEQRFSLHNVPQGPGMYPSVPQDPVSQSQWTGNGIRGNGPAHGRLGRISPSPYDYFPITPQAPTYQNGPPLSMNNHPAANLRQMYTAQTTNGNPYHPSVNAPNVRQNGSKRSHEQFSAEADAVPAQSPPKRVRKHNIPDPQQALYNHQRRAAHLNEQLVNGSSRASAVGGGVPVHGSNVFNRPTHHQAPQDRRPKRNLDQALPEAEEIQRPRSPKRQKKDEKVEGREIPRKKGFRKLRSPTCFYKMGEEPAVHVPGTSSATEVQSNSSYGQPQRRGHDSRSRGQQPARYVLVNKDEPGSTTERNQNTLTSCTSRPGHSVPPQETSAQLNPDVAGVVSRLQNVAGPSGTDQNAYNGLGDQIGMVYADPYDDPSAAGFQPNQPAASMGPLDFGHEQPIQSHSNNIRHEDNISLMGSNAPAQTHHASNGNHLTNIYDASNQNRPGEVAENVNPSATTWEPMQDTSYLSVGNVDPVDADYTGWEDLDWRAEDEIARRDIANEAARPQNIFPVQPPIVDEDGHNGQTETSSEPTNQRIGNNESRPHGNFPTQPPIFNEEDHNRQAGAPSNQSISDNASRVQSSPATALPTINEGNNNTQAEADREPPNQSHLNNAVQPQSSSHLAPPSANDRTDEEDDEALLADIREGLGSQTDLAEPPPQPIPLDELFAIGWSPPSPSWDE